jgi:hypothetical protein
MKRNVLLAALALFLAVLGPFPALAEQPIHERATADPLEQLFNAGWIQSSPGVLKRDLGHGMVEVLGLGAEGLQYRLQELREQLWYLKAAYDKQPTAELKDAIRAYRSEIRRVMENLETAKSFTELDARTKAGIDCTIRYGAHATAFALSGSAQGVGANADAYFNSNCGQTGEVWAHAYGEGFKADNSWWTVTKTDPLAGGSAPYTGTNVSATAPISLNVVRQCYSYAYASMTSYDIGVVYSTSASNYSCPPPALVLPQITSNYGNSVAIYGYDCATVTWTAYPSSGAPPYTYSWTANSSTTVVGTGQTYSRTFCGSNVTTTGSWRANVTVRDSSSPQQSASSSHTVTINYYYQYQGGGGCTYTSEDGKLLEQPVCP